MCSVVTVLSQVTMEITSEMFLLVDHVVSSVRKNEMEIRLAKSALRYAIALIGRLSEAWHLAYSHIRQDRGLSLL